MQIGKDCHGANPWEWERQVLFQFFGVLQIQVVQSTHWQLEFNDQNVFPKGFHSHNFSYANVYWWEEEHPWYGVGVWLSKALNYAKF